MLMIDNAEQYQDLVARHARNQAWAKQYEKKNGWTVIPADANPPDDARINNEERSAIEVWEFLQSPPDKYFAYVQVPSSGLGSGAWGKLTTWTGQQLGDVVFGRKWRDNFGGIRYSIEVKAINGTRYAGTYFASSGDYARIRKLKRA